MQSATTLLAIIQERGKKGLPLERLYRHLFNKELYLMAYGKIYRNKGAMTPGTTEETVDEMSLAKIDSIINALRYERYQWTPTRRVYIEKKHSKKQRPLSMPSWSDKLLQEVIRLLLDAYFDVQFSDLSHGFRPARGCHTALQEVDSWLGTTWFIEGDIAACFDSLDSSILLGILAEQIHDGRFIRLIKELLQTGYLHQWKYHATLSGAPQGGIVSPLLANIYLNKLDKYIEQALLPQSTRGVHRRNNPAYERLNSTVARRRKEGKHEEAEHMRKQMQCLPSRDPDDPDFRRLRYTRYADDWLIGLIGPKAEAEEIKQRISTFLREKLKLALSEEKTLITHARTQEARFLGYNISTMQDDKYRPHRKRNVNGKIKLSVPKEVLKKKCQRYMENGKAIDRRELETESIFGIVALYQSEYRGLVEYYRLANDLYKLNHLQWVMETSLTKTLARKLKISVTKVYKRYQSTFLVEGKPLKGLQVTITREGKKPLIAKWGGISLKRKPRATLNDQPPALYTGRSEIERRLLAQQCELCGATLQVEVHHIRALKDLQKKGRGEKPNWMRIMASRQRKTLVVCRKCHVDIHRGKLDKRPKPEMCNWRAV